MEQSSGYENILAVGKEILASQDIDEVLKTSIDKLIEISGAERGFVVLFNDKGENLFQTARNLEKDDIEKPEFETSRTIIDRVKSGKVPVFRRDAMEDADLSKSISVDTLRILSVICLPLLHQDEVFGVVYLDNRSVLGAFTKKTFDIVENFAEFISLAAHHAVERKDLEERKFELEKQLRNRYDFKEIIGNSPQMMQVLELISQVAETDATVLIEGESGTGKELAARAIHFNSSRREKPLISINCGALPESLLESEFFGHEKGAFTGALKRHRGKFEQADGGTLFLDEIHTMSPQLQVKLLRLLQTGEFTPLGSETTQICDVRIVAASKPNLKQLAEKNEFREDLYYRLNVIRINMPTLRERKVDVLPLAEYFLQKEYQKMKKKPAKLSAKVKQILSNYSFPGNVRELENIIRRAAILSRGQVIDIDVLPDEIRSSNKNKLVLSGETNLSFKEAKEKVVADFERQYLLQVLEQSNGIIKEAAKMAGMHTKNFHEKLIRYNIRPKKSFL
jgi:transcriptional regulator with GAF, ATPase, and Fis domain